MMLDVSKIIVHINKHLKIGKLCKILDLPHTEYEDKVSISCIYHQDKHPSAFIDLKTNHFHCSTCNKSLLAINFFVHHLLITNKVTSEQDALNFLKEHTTGQEKYIPLNIIEVFHQQLLESTNQQAIIAEKGITLDLIKKHRIGIHNTSITRFTIPIINSEGYCEALLSYLPNAKTNKFYFYNPENKKELKQLNTIYLIDQFKYDSIILCGGPLKAIIAAEELNKHGIGAVSLTTGEGAQIPEIYRHLFKNKHIYVCYDVDKAGIAGAKRALYCLALVSKFLYIINLPLNLLKYPKGDITNYLIDEKQLLFPLISDPNVTVPFDTIDIQDLLPQDPILTTFTELVHGERHTNQLYQLDVKTVGFTEQTVQFVTKLQIICSREESHCSFCKIYNEDKDTLFDLQADHPTQIDLLTGKDLRHNTSYKDAMGIPRKCNSPVFIPKQRISAHECELTSATLSPTEQSIIQRGYFIAATPAKNDICLNIIAREVIDENATPILLISKAERTNNIFLTPPTFEECDYISASKPIEWTESALQEWYNNRYGYLAQQHGIIGRSKMNFLIDLTFHSVLEFYFNKTKLNGWLSLMILGDTGTGKSTMLKKLFELYKYGTFKYQATGSRAGWVGGMVKSNKNKMFFKPGVIPLNDGGLVCIEELKNLDEDILRVFITAMSDGFVDISFIQAHQSQARVRFIFTSNPRKSNSLTKEPSIHLMKSLLGSEEAFRRIDCAYVTFKSATFLEPILSPTATLDPDILPILVQYAWSRTINQVQFEEEAINAIYEHAKLFSIEFYHPTLLLVDPSSQHNKFARLAVAFACLTFSTNEDNVIVKKCHVDFIAAKLREIYNGEELGYKASVAINKQYIQLDFNEMQTNTLKQFNDATNVNSYIAILNNIHGTFDNAQFISLFTDRQVGINVFAWCTQLGFLQPHDNKLFSVSEKWKRYAQCNYN